MGQHLLTKSDCAKYPFTKKAAEYIGALNLDIEELESPAFNNVLNRAEDRICEAALYAQVSNKSTKDDVEIASFPIAVMMMSTLANNSLKRRYAVAEAKRVSTLLENDDKGKLMDIAEDFNWKIKLLGHQSASTFDFALYFSDFLKNTMILRDHKWKLVNRLLIDGEVYLTQREVARLIEEEVLRHIEEKLKIKTGFFPKNIEKRMKRLRELFKEERREVTIKDFPEIAVSEAFPPCVKRLFQSALSGHRISHIERFTLTSFLTNINMSKKDIFDLYRSTSDFNERITRYQVEHIIGDRGSRTKYVPPSCDTLRTHGICPEIDVICKNINHPLSSYRRRLKSIEQ
jgi:DNA primase large subunit